MKKLSYLLIGLMGIFVLSLTSCSSDDDNVSDDGDGDNESPSEFYFTGFETSGASENVEFDMDDPEEDGLGDYTGEQEIIINPDEINPEDISFTASFNEDAHIKMWVDLSGLSEEDQDDGILDGESLLEVVDSDEKTESPFKGTSGLLSALSAAPDLSTDLIIAGSTEEEPSSEPDPDDSNMEVIKVKIKIDSGY